MGETGVRLGRSDGGGLAEAAGVWEAGGKERP